MADFLLNNIIYMGNLAIKVTQNKEDLTKYNVEIYSNGTLNTTKIYNSETVANQKFNAIKTALGSGLIDLDTILSV